ncbi:MAG: hypothetical protein OXC38_06870 [Gammaproteobacteria bacterium]|nr:hypothetical protein [Gammaproteobacteria bacterium]
MVLAVDIALIGWNIPIVREIHHAQGVPDFVHKHNGSPVIADGLKLIKTVLSQYQCCMIWLEIICSDPCLPWGCGGHRVSSGVQNGDKHAIRCHAAAGSGSAPHRVGSEVIPEPPRPRLSGSFHFCTRGCVDVRSELPIEFYVECACRAAFPHPVGNSVPLSDYLNRTRLDVTKSGGTSVRVFSGSFEQSANGTSSVGSV